MKLKKSWFSYIIWILFTLMNCFFIGNYLNTFFWENDFFPSRFIVPAVSGSFICFFLVTAGIIALINKIKTVMKESGNAFTIRYLDVIFSFIIMAGAFVYRLFQMKISGFVMNNQELLNSCMVTKDNQGFFYIQNNTSDNSNVVYAFLQHLMYMFLGNQPEAVLYLSIVLQAMAVIMGYFLVRKIAGRISGICFTIIYGLLGSRMLLFSDSAPMMVLIFIELAIFYLVLKQIYSLDKLDIGNTSSFLKLAVAGFMTGFGIYFDSMGALILIAGLLTVAVLPNKEKKSYRLKLIHQGSLLVGCVIGFFALIAIEWNLTGVNFLNLLKSFGSHFSNINITEMQYTLNQDNLIIVMAICIVLFWCISFIFSSHDSFLPLTIFSAGVMGIFFFFSKNESYQYILNFSWMLMASAAIESLFLCESEQKIEEIQETVDLMENKNIPTAASVMASDQKVDSEDSMFDNSVFNDEPLVAVADTPVVLETPVVASETSEVISETSTIVAPDEIVVERVSMELEKIGEIEPPVTKKEVKFIENPLPLPKKHEKKEITYAYELDERELHYDFDISENEAHFDIED